MATSDVFVCTICNTFASRSYGPVLRHIGVVHRFGPSCSIRCGIDGCPATYNSEKYESFRSHVYRKHRAVLYATQDSSETTGDPDHEVNPINTDGDQSVVDDFPVENSYSSETMKKAAAVFLLKTLEERRVTQNALAGIVADTDSLWGVALDHIQHALRDKFGTSIELRDILDQQLQHPFQGLQSHYMREKYFKESFSLTEPTERVLDRYFENKNGHIVETRDVCYDIPLRDSLEKLLNTETVRDHVFNSHSRGGEMMGDFCDGELYKSHPLFLEDPCALQIQLYYDEVEVCNPIGSRRGVHKLGLFYYTLGNLPPRLRSSLKSIHLLNVCRYTDVEKYGIDVMLEPFVEEIKKLEKDDGVNFNINGDSVSLRGTITLVSADNLAAQAIGGYKALNAAFRKCRTCMAVDDTMQTKFLECDFQLRTRAMHASHCADLGGALHSHIATTYGLVRDSILNSTRYFHIVEGLVPDIMHDLLEGALQLCTKLLLNHVIVQERKISLEDFNSRISCFHYGPSDIRNKPSLISHTVLTSSDNKLSQSASQMWCLARALPFLIGDKVMEGDKRWANFLQLLSIVDYSFAPVLTHSKAAYLGMMIEDFLTDFKELYDRRIIPKMHYMVHFPSWIKKCGPLVHMWCMRYESKHAYFKHLARVVGNFKNILKTLATRHQRYVCLQLLEPSLYLKQAVNARGGVPCSVSSLNESTELMAAAPHLNAEAIVYRLTSVEISGTKYHQKDIVVRFYEHDEPVFGRVLYFIATPLQEYYFVLDLLDTAGFSEHFHAYRVSSTSSEIDVCVQADLVDYHPLTESKVFNPPTSQSFVRLKYHVFS